MRKVSVLCVLLQLCVLSFGTSLQAKGNWGLYYTGPTFKEIKAGIANVNNKTGMIPVGISYYNKKVYFMFIADNAIGASNYYIDTIARNASRAVIQKSIQSRVRRGWVPFDLTYTSQELVVLYLKCNVSIEAWKIVPSINTWAAIEKTVKRNRGFFPLGLTFSKNKAYLLLIKSSSAGVSNWMMKNCGSKKPVFNATVNQMMGRGFIPYGIEYKGTEVGVCFLK